MSVRVVLVIRESPLASRCIASLASGHRLQVVGVAHDVATALSLVRALRPDVVGLSSTMPGASDQASEDLARHLMSRNPVPIVVFEERPGGGPAACAAREAEARFLAAGAALVLPTTVGAGAQREARALADALVAMAGLKVVRLRSEGPVRAPAPRGAGRPRAAGRKRILALASSTGGPQAIRTLLRGLPPDFPAPILVVQHITEGFVASLVSWLRHSLDLHAKVAEDGETRRRATVSLAPDDLHLGVGNAGEARLSAAPPVKGFRPSGTFLFQEVARVYGPTALGAILTGLGDDGIDGLRILKAAGGHVFAQDERSSVVFGMPRMAIEAGVVDRVVPLVEMSAAVRTAFGVED